MHPLRASWKTAGDGEGCVGTGHICGALLVGWWGMRWLLVVGVVGYICLSVLYS